MMTFIRATLLAAIALLPTAPLHADLFTIDVSGSDAGNTLHVTGILEVNVDTDVIATSKLTFRYNAETPIQLPAIPSIGGPGVDFIASAGMLFINPTPTQAGSVTWSAGNDTSPLGEAILILSDLTTGSVGGEVSYELTFFRFIDPFASASSTTASDRAIKFGTAVPEASAFMYLSLVGLGVAGASRWRKRRMLNSAVHS